MEDKEVPTLISSTKAIDKKLHTNVNSSESALDYNREATKSQQSFVATQKVQEAFYLCYRSPSPEQLDARRDSSREHSPHEEEESARTPARLITEQVYSLLLIWSPTVSSVQSSPVAQLCPTLQPHGLQHPRLPCPSPTSGACSNSCPSSRWCHPTISSSVVPFSSCL